MNRCTVESLNRYIVTSLHRLVITIFPRSNDSTVQRFNVFLIALFLFALASVGRTQIIQSGAVRSSSGQFVIMSQPSSSASRFPGLGTNRNYIFLEAPLLVVSCERIHEALNHILEVPPSASPPGTIYLNLRPAQGTEDTITFVTEKFGDHWKYSLNLPDVLERSRYVEAVVQVLLLQMANRNNDSRSVETPRWLAMGIAEELLSSDESALILPPPRWSVNGLTISPTYIESRSPDTLARAREILNARAPLTFQELSWPTDEQLSGFAAPAYRASAQLFVARLLQLNGGRACLRTMVGELRNYLNWQLAFLQAFQPHFPKLLDVEKWWALQVVQFTGRDLTELWTVAQSCNKLEEVLLSPVQVKMSTNEPPLETRIPVQTIIREWDPIRQKQTLQLKLRELELLRVQVAQEVIPLVDSYREVIAAYWKRGSFTVGFSNAKVRPIPDAAAEETLRQLDILDARREAMKPSSQNPVAATAP